MEVYINVVDQELRVENNLKYYAAGTQNFVKFVFNLGSDWSGLTVTAQFNQDGVGAVNVKLDANGSAYLPSEIVPGKFTMSLFGVNGSSVRATTNMLEMTMNDNKLTDGISSVTLTPTVYEQFVAEVRAMKALVGTPLTASTPAKMTDTSKIYVYTGSSGSGYIKNNWYYHNGTSWVSGGVYQSAAVETDKTLSVSDMAADAKVVGDKITGEISQIQNSMGYLILDVTTGEFLDKIIDSYNKLQKDGDKMASREIKRMDSWKRIAITSSSRNAYVTFLKTSVLSLNAGASITTSLATGETGRRQISMNNTESFDIPDDCKFINIETLSSSTNYTPARIIIYGDISVESIYNMLGNEIQSVREDVGSEIEDTRNTITKEINQVQDSVGYTILDVTTGELLNKIIDNSNKMDGSSNKLKSREIKRMSNWKSIEITSSSQNAYVTFLKDSVRDIGSGQSMAACLASGYTERQQIQKTNKTASFNIPDDCEFINIETSSSSGDMTPARIIIYGDSTDKSLYNVINDKIAAAASYSFRYRGELKTTDDLSKLEDIGIYTATSTVSSALTDSPTTGAFTLVIFPKTTGTSTGLYPAAEMIFGNKIYARIKTSSGWGDWRQIPESTDITNLQTAIKTTLGYEVINIMDYTKGDVINRSIGGNNKLLKANTSPEAAQSYQSVEIERKAGWKAIYVVNTKTGTLANNAYVTFLTKSIADESIFQEGTDISDPSNENTYALASGETGRHQIVKNTGSAFLKIPNNCTIINITYGKRISTGNAGTYLPNVFGVITGGFAYAVADQITTMADQITTMQGDIEALKTATGLRSSTASLQAPAVTPLLGSSYLGAAPVTGDLAGEDNADGESEDVGDEYRYWNAPEDDSEYVYWNTPDEEENADDAEDTDAYYYEDELDRSEQADEPDETIQPEDAIGPETDGTTDNQEQGDPVDEPEETGVEDNTTGNMPDAPEDAGIPESDITGIDNPEQGEHEVYD